MKYKTILKKLEEDYGWSSTKEFTEMQKELVEDVAKIVSSQLEPPVQPEIVDTIKQLREFLVNKPDEGRLHIFGEITDGYCKHCGTDDPRCQC